MQQGRKIVTIIQRYIMWGLKTAGGTPFDHRANIRVWDGIHTYESEHL
jgi:hypothetical protein